MTNLLESLIREAVNFEADAFDADEGVDGADLVEWFAQWRLRARAATRPVSAQEVGVGRPTSRGRADHP